jgi:microcystin degradation protein MlrC
MKYRVFVGGLHHESDTFNPIITSKEDIWVLRGEQLLKDNHKGAINGIINTLVCAGYDIVPSLIARAVPNGEWALDYYNQLKKEFLQTLQQALPVDALCLSLHGSMRVKQLGPAEQDLLEAIRKIVPNTPIISSLDMHATVTKGMIKNCNAFVGYKCAPHTDTYETGIHAALMTIRILEEKIVPCMSAYRIPMLIAGEQSETSVEPMKSLIKSAREIEKTPHVLAASYLLGFPWADSGENGVHALVVTDGEPLLDYNLALQMAENFWNRRKEFAFYTETRTPIDTIQEARKSIENGVFPVVISDSGDNPTAGSSQDVTTFLAQIIEEASLTILDPPLVYQAFYDPKVVTMAIKAGVGKTIKGTLGASFDNKTSHPIEIEAKVIAIEERWEKANGCDLALLHTYGIDIVVTSKHVGCYDPDMMRALGIEVEKRKGIIVKLGYLEPEIRAISKRSIMALTTGSSDELFERLPYNNLPRPIFPLDKNFDTHFELLK